MMLNEVPIQKLIDVFHDSVLLIGPQGIIKGVNRQFCKLTGMSQESLIDTTPDYPFIPEDQRSHLYRWMGEIDKLRWAINIDIVNADGVRIPVRFEPNRLASGDDGNLLAVLIFDKTQVEERHFQHAFTSFSEATSQALATTSVGGIIRTWNPAAETMYKLSQSEAVGTSIRCIFPAERAMEISTLMEEVFSSGKPVIREITNQSSDGRLFPVEMTLAPMVNAQGKIFGAVFCIQDKSRETADGLILKRYEQEIVKNLRFNALGRFLKGIVSYSNNVLHALGVQLGEVRNLLPEDLGADPKFDNFQSILNRLHDANARLLELSSRPAESLPKQGLTLDAADTVGKVLDLCKYTFPSNVSVLEHIMPGRVQLAVSDAAFAEILMQTLSVTQEALAFGGVIKLGLDRIRLEEGDALLRDHPGLKPGLYAQLQVEDDGEGFVEELHHKTLDEIVLNLGWNDRRLTEFFYLKKRIQERHRGALEARIEPGMGLVLRILLPVLDMEPAALPKEELAYEKSRDIAPDSPKHILLVDDEDVILALGETVLTSLGYRVSTARNGAKAVEIFETDHGDIDLVIMDIVMPKMNGLDAMRRMKEIDDGVPVLIATGYSDIATPENVKNAGAAHLILKPFKLDDLSSLVRRLLAPQSGDSAEINEEFAPLNSSTWKK